MRKTTALVVALALVGFCSLASAQEFSENFDSYAPGTPLHGVAGWKGWGNVAGAGAPVSNKYAYSGTNSVEVVAAADLVHEFTANGGLWKFTAMQYIPSGSTGNTYFIILNQYDDPGATNDWSVQLNYSLTGGTITAEAEGGNAVANIVYDRWVELKFIIDLDANTCAWYYDGELIKTHTWDANGHKTIQALDLYGNNASSVYVDDIKLSIYDRSEASEPVPADSQTDVVQDATLRWTPGIGTVARDVYFGASFDAVAGAGRGNPMDVLVSQAQAETSYTVTTLLDFGQTYYWRVDEIGPAPDSKITQGEVWSFTVEPYVYPVTAITATASSAQVGMGPENAINGAGLDGDGHSSETTQMWMTTGTAKPDWIQFEFGQVYKLDEMWVWNSNQMIEALLGFGAKDVTVEYSTDGETWAVLDGVPAFAQATGLAGYQANTKVAFGGVMAKFVKLTINATWGGVAPQTGLSEVRFYHVPVHAFEPVPADGATGVLISAELDWRPGREATSHKVYVDADQEAVANGAVPAGTTDTHGYTPGDLDFATTYYWKVDEVGDASAYPGNVWSFTTSDHEPIDDFEAYNDDDHRIYSAWVDGLTDTAKGGSQVGYDVSPFAEQTIVHGGAQSMPLMYDNTASPFYSEAERTFASPQDWTAGGGDTLSLWFRGIAPGFEEAADGAILMNGIGADIWGNSDAFRLAYKTLNGNGSMIARVDSIYNSNVWAKGGVMIRQSVLPGSVHAFMPITPGGASAGNGASFQHRLTANGASTNNDNTAPAVAAPYWVKIERNGNSFTGSISPDGVTWKQLGTAQTITMTGPVLIGLALCSHDAAVTTSAEFSNLAFTGNVTGAWQVADIGLAQSEGNSAEPIYLTVKDSAGKTATLVNPDSVASGRPSWQQWMIPLSDLTAAGVKATAVKSMAIGVGNKTAPAKGGAGTLYLDDIAFGNPDQ